MNMLPLYNLIIHHYLQAHVLGVVIFNCWDSKGQLDFLRNANDHLLRTQMVDTNKDFEFPGDHLNGMYSALGIYLDFNCNKSGYILNEASDFQLFISKYNWLIVDESHNFTKVREQFEDAMMSVDAQITYAGLETGTSANSGYSFTLYDVYNNGKNLGGKLNMTFDKRVTCGRANCRTEYLSDLHLRTKYGNRCHLDDTTFRISTIVTRYPINASEDFLLEYLLSVNNSHIDTIPRYGYRIVAILQDLMKYRAKHIFTDAWSWNETSGASFGDLALGNAELSSSGFFPTQPRLKYISVILQISSFRSVFLFRTPRNEGLYGGVFLSPFSPPTWIAFGVVLIGFALMLWAVFAIEFRICQHIKFIPSLLSTFLISFGLACFQGAALIPRTAGGRIAFFSLSVITFIMYNYYTSIVVSSLVGSPIKSNIKTVGQLADSSLEIGIDPEPYTVTFLKISTSSDVMRLVRKKIRDRMSLDSDVWLKAEEGMLKVREGGYAYHSEASTVYRAVQKYYTDHELCDLNEVKLRAESSLATLINKKSTYKEIVRIYLIQMLERGVISKHRQYWMKSKLQCFSNNFLINVGLEYTGPLFVFLGIAYILTIIVLILENIYHKFSVRC